MKGMIFTEFLALVEEKFGLELVDTIITEAELPSGGAYTSVGSYPAGEMVALLGRLAAHTGLPVSALLKTYGQYLFDRLASSYTHFLTGVTDPLHMLASLEDHIHVEVMKLYPEAELPRFDTVWLPDGRLSLHYHSHRGLADLAEGLILGCFAYYATPVLIERTDQRPDGTDTVFVLQKQS